MSAWTYRCQSAGKAAPKIVPLRSRTLSADSEEKREPVSDINTAMVDSLKVLDPKGPIREADIPRHSKISDFALDVPCKLGVASLTVFGAAIPQ